MEKKTSNILIIVLLFGLFYFFPNSALAVKDTTSTTDVQELQKLIEQLQNQIKELREQIAALKTELKEVKEEIKLTKTLYKGLSDEEVKEVQKFLSQFREIYPEGLVTGYFGTLTEKAIKKFQEKNDIPATGLVGPLTREKINEFLTQEAEEIKVTICHIPPGNPSAKQTITIGDSALKAHLEHGDTMGVCPVVSIPTSTPTPTSSVPTVPQPQFSLQVSVAVGAQGSNFVPGDTNARVAKIAFTATNDDVVINKLMIRKQGGSAGCYIQNFKLYNYTGATPVQVGTVVSPDFNCQAVFDNLNLALSKERWLTLELWVDFLSAVPIGDTFSFGVIEAECASNTCPWGVTGLPAYTPQIRIVSVAIPTITVLFPAGGEKLIIGQPYTFKWLTKNLPSDAKIMIRLEPMGSTLIISYNELSGLVDDGSETWTIPASVSPGKYMIDVAATFEISGSYQRIVVGSDTFYIVRTAEEAITTPAPETVITSSVTVLSPNDYTQEKWLIGGSYTIRWETTDYSKTSLIKIFLFHNKTGAEELIVETTNTGSYVWTVPQVLGKMKLGEGLNYKIRIELNVSGSNRRIYDDCDLFSIQ